MKLRQLGNTDIKVSELCFGSLTMSPLQANLNPEKGGALIEYAYSKGINFIDTAELYNNYSHIAVALREIDRGQFVIATKSYAYSKETAQKSLEKALREMGTDYIDIFLLHEQESELTIKGHYEAIEYFIKAKEAGKIRAFGISTHRIEAVKSSLKYKEIEILHPIINKDGLGIQDGTIEEMLKNVEIAYNSGKGIYSMKPFGGGHLIQQVEKAFNFVRELPFLHAIAIGMQSYDEIDANRHLVEFGFIPSNIKSKLSNHLRRLHIADWCIGCGQCIEICNHKGIIMENSKAVPVHSHCVLCGYCASGCPEFCIKVV